MVEKFGNNTTQISQETIDRHFAISLEHNDEFFEQFVQMGADVNVNHGLALIKAVEDNDLVRMELLLEYGADPTLLRKYALKLAAKNENLEALELMYKDKYRQNRKGDEEDLACYEIQKIITFFKFNEKIYCSSLNELIISTNNLEFVKKLLPKINNKEDQEFNLRYAMETANVDMVKLVYVPQKIDDYLMQKALLTNSPEIIDFMLAQCNGELPSRNTLDDDGVVTMRNLGVRGCTETLKYLMDMPSNSRKLNESNWNLLLKFSLKEAIECRHIETIKLLSQYVTAYEVDASEMFKHREMQQDDAFSVVELLIENQIIQQGSKCYQRIAEEAAQADRIDVLKLLESHGISYDLIQALKSAIISEALSAIKYFLAKEELVLSQEMVIELFHCGRYTNYNYEENYEKMKMLMMKEESSKKE